jgi:hypothetical protein
VSGINLHFYQKTQVDTVESIVTPINAKPLSNPFNVASDVLFMVAVGFIQPALAWIPELHNLYPRSSTLNQEPLNL